MAAAPAQQPVPSERTWGESFKAVYADACLKHDNLIRLPDPIRDELATKLDAQEQRYSSATSTMVRIFILLAIIALPLIRFGDGWWSQHQMTVQQWASHMIGPLGKPDWNYVAAMVFLPVVWLVFMWTPLRKNMLASMVLLESHPDRSSRWSLWNIFFSVVLCIFLMAIGQGAWDLRTKTIGAILAEGIASALLWAVVILIGVPVLYLMMRILLWLVSGLERDAGVQLLAQEFLRMLLRLDGITDPALLTKSERRDLVDRMVRISRTMSQLHDPRPDFASEWATLQMRLASQNVLRLASWLYFPQAGTFTALREEMIRYANILLSGNLDELPRGEVGEMEGLHIVVREMSGWRKALLHLVMVLWFIAPLAITGTLIAIFHWESRLSGPIEILAGLVYTIWSLWGLVLFVRHLGDDTRTLVIDVFKTVVGRK